MLTKAPLLPLRYPVERLYQSLFVLSDVSTAIKRRARYYRAPTKTCLELE